LNIEKIQRFGIFRQECALGKRDQFGISFNCHKEHDLLE
jgi:hypothetical protein